MSEHRTSEFGTAMSVLIAIAILITVVYALTAGRFAAMNSGPGTPEEIAARLAPIGKVNLAGATPAPTAPAPAATAAATDEGPGVAVYEKACIACHGTGIAGAPKLGDKAAWEPRIAQGLDGLLATAINGKGAMPPRGTCATCSDDDLKATIEFMLSKVGFAPEAKAPAPATPEPAPAPEAPQAGMSGMGGMSGMAGMGGMGGMSGMEGMGGESAPVEESEAAAPAGN